MLLQVQQTKKIIRRNSLSLLSTKRHDKLSWFGIIVCFALLLTGCIGGGQQVASTPTAAPTLVAAAATPEPISPPSQKIEAEVAEIEEDKEAEYIKANSEVYSALVEAGIKDALVDVSKDRVVVGFIPPANLSKENALSYAVGAAGGFLPEAKQVVVQVFNEDGKIQEQYETTPAEVVKVIEGQQNFEDLLAKAKVQITANQENYTTK